MEKNEIPSYLSEDQSNQPSSRAVFSSNGQPQPQPQPLGASQHSIGVSQPAPKVEESDSESDDDDDAAASDADKASSVGSASQPSLASSGQASSGGGSQKTGSSGSSWSRYSFNNPLIQFFRRLILWVIDFYYRKVPYKAECFILLLLLLPFAVLAVSMILIEQITFQSMTMGVVFKVAMIVIGLSAIWGAEVVNKRHAFLNNMAEILGGRATIRSISDLTRGQGTNRVFKYMAYFFYGCLLAAELSVFVTPLMQKDEYGVSLSLHEFIDRNHLEQTSDILSMGMGGVKTCAQCTTIRSGLYEVMPVGVYMEKLAERGVDYIVYTEEDVIAMQVHCILLKQPIAITKGVRIETEAFHAGNNTVLANMGFTALEYEEYKRRDAEYWKNQKEKADAKVTQGVNDETAKKEGSLWKRGGAAAPLGALSNATKWTEEELKDSKMISRSCDVKLRARRMKTVTEYSTDSIGNVKKRRVLDIKPADPATCNYLGEHCFNEPERKDLLDLSYPLLEKTLIELSSVDVLHSAVIPYPGKRSYKDKDYARLIKKFMLMGFLNTGLILYDRPAKVATFNLNNARILAIQPELKWITIVVSILCVLVGVALIAMDLVRLQRANNVMLRKMDNAIHLGKAHFEAIAFIAHKSSSTSHDREDWDLVPIRFGEDRKTIMDPIGRLMFGTKKDVIKMKLERSYY